MTELHFRETLSDCGMDVLLRERGRVLAAFSGGADSSCLLFLLNRYCTENGIEINAAHVNHGIRGEEADRDEAFCRDRCRELGIPLSVLRCDVPALAAERRQSLEECARSVRYAYFDELAGKDALIATAHNATDNLETVLFRMMRGTGLAGLCGIPPVREGRILRPLIRDSADSIRLWCSENGVPYVTDRTNLEAGCTRNRLRLNVLPQLREIFPDPEGAVSRMTGLLSEDAAYLAERAESAVGDDAASVPRDTLLAAHPAVASRILRTLAERAGGKTPEAQHTREILAMVKSGSAGSVSLPGSVRCVLTRSEIRMEPDGRGSASQNSAATETEVDLRQLPPGNGVLYEDGFCRILYSLGTAGTSPPEATNPGPEENIYKSSTTVSLCFDKICSTCRIRTRRPGDTVRYGGLTRRVKTLFSDRKLPPDLRARLPLLEDGGGILWIPGFPPRDGTRWTGEGRTLVLTCQLRDADAFPLPQRHT